MKFNDIKKLKVGILGGGQLGKMLCLAGATWDLQISVLDPDINCSARHYCTRYVQGDFNNFEEVLDFGADLDILTVEIEHVNTQALARLQQLGKIVHPDPKLLELIKDKSKQKNWYKQQGIPTEDFHVYTKKTTQLLEYPKVWKSAQGGYDGKGVAFLKTAQDFGRLPDVPHILERATDIEKEIAVMVARNPSGQVVTYPPVEMVFDATANLLDYQLCPARLDKELEQQAQQIAENLIKRLKICGVLAVELFLTKQGVLLVNEIAPRPHNSGHHTIETVETSQFEQHLRAILDLPLGGTRLLSDSVLLNILGDKGHTGRVQYQGFDAVYKTSGAHLHLYGKNITKPYRKMGHLTIASQTVTDALDKALYLKQILKVKAER